MNGTMFHALLLETYSSPDDFPSPEEHRTQQELYINDLIDSICGMLSAPLSPLSKTVLAQRAEERLALPATDDELPVFGEGNERGLLTFEGD